MDAAMFKKDLDFVYNVAYKLTQDRSESEDLAQETLIIAWERENSLRSLDARLGWLKKICINLFYMKHRKKKGYKELSMEIITEDKIDYVNDETQSNQLLPEDELFAKESIRQVRNDCFLGMTQELKLNQRIIFMSVEVFGMSLKDAGEVIGISDAAAKAHLYRSRKRLNQFFSTKCQWFNPDSLCKCEAYLDFKDDLFQTRNSVKPTDDYFNLEKEKEDLIVKEEVSQRIKSIYHNLPDHYPGEDWYNDVVEVLNDRY